MCPHLDLLPHLREQPRVLRRQSLKVGLGPHVGVAESVLHGGRCADVLVEELLSRLLGDGFGRHDCSGWPWRRGRDGQVERCGETDECRKADVRDGQRDVEWERFINKKHKNNMSRIGLVNILTRRLSNLYYTDSECNTEAQSGRAAP